MTAQGILVQRFESGSRAVPSRSGRARLASGLLALALFAGAMSLGAGSAYAVDAFDRHPSAAIKKRIAAGEPVAEVSSAQAAGWKILGPGVVSPAFVVQTQNGHYAKAIVSWGLRKGAGDKRTPVLVIERYVTFDRDRGDRTLAAGKNVILFPGYNFSFEIGQVVPAEESPDLQFGADRKIHAQGDAKIYPLDGPVVAEVAGEKFDPAAHEGVDPRDFTGTWKVNADGRWLGRWDLEADKEGKVKGRYISADTSSEYPLKGRISGEPHRLLLDVEMPNAVQQFEVYLWTTDKSTLAGTTTMVDRTFGFYATREEAAK